MTSIANPYEQGSAQGIITATMSNNKSANGQGAATDKPVNYNPVSDLSLKSYAAQQSAVNRGTETVAGQVDSILAKDSPLMQRARALALQNMAKRGLVNSSMAQGAGVASMTDQATQIGGADAQIYSQRAIANMDAANQASQFNAGENNATYRLGLDIASKFGLQKDQQGYNTSEREASQLYNTDERTDQNRYSTSERMGQQGYNTDERNATQGYNAWQAGINRDTNERLTIANQQFQANQAQLDRDQQIAMTKLQDSLGSGSVPKTFAANTALNTMNQINAILADKDIAPEDKKAATANIISVANSNLQWGATFYNTPLPSISTPGTTSGVINPGPQPDGQTPKPSSIPRYYNQFFPNVS